MVKSPCINICKMDSHSGLCLGCHRTIDEISAWSRLDDTARQVILDKIAERRQSAPASPAKAHA